MALPMTDTMHLPALRPSHSNSTKSSSSATGSTGRSSSHSVLDSVLNIEEYLAANPLPTIPEKGTSKKKQKLAAKTSDDDLVPRALSSRSSESIVLLNNKIQLYALGRPDFTFNHVLHSTAGDGWSVRLRLAGPEEEIDLEERGPFASKQEAKEAVCVQALEVLKEWEADGKVGTADRGKKRKGADGEAEAKAVGEEKEAFVNWTGLLLEFQRSNSAPQPTYTDYALGTRFSCTCSLDNVPGRIFGSPTDLFAGKKAARQNASRLAVEYFKEVGEWPENAGLNGLQQGIRKKKGKKSGGGESSSSSSGEEEKNEGPSDDRSINDASPSPSDSEENRLTSAPKGKGKAEPELDFGPTGTTTAPIGSYASLAASLARTLNLGTPQYHFHRSSTLSSDFHTVSCTFPQAGERRFREEPVGFVRHVHGKKKAKEECARAVVGVLEEVRKERRDALKRGVDVDVEMEARMEGGEEEGEEVFEDAVEVMSVDGK